MGLFDNLTVRIIPHDVSKRLTLRILLLVAGWIAPPGVARRHPDARCHPADRARAARYRCSRVSTPENLSPNRQMLNAIRSVLRAEVIVDVAMYKIGGKRTDPRAQGDLREDEPAATLIV